MWAQVPKFKAALKCNLTDGRLEGMQGTQGTHTTHNNSNKNSNVNGNDTGGNRILEDICDRQRMSKVMTEIRKKK